MAQVSQKGPASPGTLGPSSVRGTAIDGRLWVFACTLAALLSAGSVVVLRARAGSSVPVAAKVGLRAPAFSLQVVGRPSERISLYDLRGRPAVLIFSCGCTSCYNCALALAAIAPRLKGVQPIGIMMNPGTYAPARVRDFREATGFRWPLLMDSNARTTLEYHSSECPRVWLIDRAGTIRYCNRSSSETPDQIAQELMVAYYKL